MAMSSQVKTIQTAYLEQLLAADMVPVLGFAGGKMMLVTLKNYQCRLFGCQQLLAACRQRS